MLEEMVKSIINKTLETDFPHLVLPAVVYATVTAAKKLPETYEVNELVIYNDETGGSYQPLREPGRGRPDLARN